MENSELQEIVDRCNSLDAELSKLRMYSKALEFAILYHCSGHQVPEDIAEIVPEYARYLNSIDCCRANNDEELLNIISQDISGRTKN